MGRVDPREPAPGSTRIETFTLRVVSTSGRGEEVRRGVAA